MSWLPSDVARCRGVGDDVDGWREGCEDCSRRLSPLGRVHMEPPQIIVFECEYRIEAP
jgi:hypothetical protein